MAVSSQAVFSEINAILVDRIQILEDIVYRLGTTEKTLKEYQRTPQVCNVEKEEQQNDDIAEAESEVSGVLYSNKLDEVLQRAKDIQLGQYSKPVKSSGDNKKDATVKPISLSSYVKSTTAPKKVNSTSSVSDVASVVSTSSRKPSVPTQISPRPAPSSSSSAVAIQNGPKYNFHDDISAQLNYFLVQKVHSLNPVRKLCVTKELYKLQANRLSASFGRPVHPQSICYGVLSKSLIESDNSTIECRQKSNTIVIRLKESFQNVVNYYKSHLKSQLESSSAHQFASNNREEILMIWLKGQKLLQLYEHYCYKAKQKQRHQQNIESKQQSERAVLRSSQRAELCSCEVCRSNRENEANLLQLVQALLSIAPFHCPLTAIPDNQNAPTNNSSGNSVKVNSHNASKTMKGIPSGLTERDQQWYTANKRKLNAFHDSFDSNAKFLVESVIGQNELMHVVSKLKECSKAEVNNRAAEKVLSTSSFNDNNERWIEGLKMFKNIHCILTKEAQDDSSCTFLNKETI